MTDQKEIQENVNMDPEKELDKDKCDSKETLNTSNEFENESVGAIKKIIDEQDKHNIVKKNEADKTVPDTSSVSHNIQDTDNSLTNSNNISNNEDDKINKELEEETLAVASSVMDMILSESETKMINKKKNNKSLNKQTLTSGDKGNNNMSLSVGSKVEAKDFGEFWYPAQIVEVDYDDMEVLVHYENASKKHDEWINVSSPRLRPLGSAITSPSKSTQDTASTVPTEPTSVKVDVPIKEEPKHEENVKLTFVVGERCLARWRDNRRFIATIDTDLGNGKYEIIFDDGVRWTCTVSRLHKLKDTTKKESLTVDTALCPSATSKPSPVYGPGPSASGSTPILTTPYHTHLFDPTRDYLGSKSERREMKRKLNIKELFNIGPKKSKIDHTPKDKTPKVVKEKKTRIMKKNIKLEMDCKVQIKAEIKTEIPDAVASIIGTVTKTENPIGMNADVTHIKTEEVHKDSKITMDDSMDMANSETLSAPETLKHEDDPVLEEEMKLEQFDHPGNEKHEEVIDRIKEVINKLEDGLNQTELKEENVKFPKPEIKEEIKIEDTTNTSVSDPIVVKEEKVKTEEQKPKKNLAKIKKGKKLRLLQEKKVKKQVEKVKSELEEMKRQVEEMRQQMLLKTEELARSKKGSEMPESFLLPGEWCCKWVNGQPVGKVCELEGGVKIDANNRLALPKRTVLVEDKRLPPGWTKQMVRRSLGHSAGKWDVVLVSPDNRRFHTKTEMGKYLEINGNETLKSYEGALMDFGVHLKLSRRMGWYTTTHDGEPEGPVHILPADSFGTSSKVKRKNLSLKSISKSGKVKDKKKKLRLKLKKIPKGRWRAEEALRSSIDAPVGGSSELSTEPPPADSILEDGYVYVGSLKVQIIENLLRCPAEGCLKNFRNNTLLKMHIKHYHRELRKMLGATPKVLDLAYARTRPTEMEIRKLKMGSEHKTLKVKLPRLPKRFTEPKPENKDIPPDISVEAPITPKPEIKIPRSQDSPKLRNVLGNKPVKRPKVLLPVRRVEPIEQISPEVKDESLEFEEKPLVQVPSIIEPLDFETAISTHTVTKPIDTKRPKEKKRKSFATIAKKTMSEDEEWFTTNNSDVETRSSFPRSGTPDSKIIDNKQFMSESNEDQKPDNLYMYSETGERIKIVHMKREEIINCHCGFREEDGLMVQCELCLCWQHALCHNIQKESEVPDKYTCSICLNPRRGRRSQRFLHDQDRLYEGLLPGAKPCESLRRSHELSGNLLRIEDALHALRIKYYVATKKDHPKLYLWAKDWETGEINLTQDRLNSDYSDLNIIISNIGKENLPIKPEEIKDIPLDMRTPPSEDPEAERFSQRDSQLLGGLLSSPGGASLDLSISTSELERLAKSVQEQEMQRCVTAPQPEAAIENGACRERLLRHIQRCQALIDARLDSIEAQVAELESQDPSFEDDETADYFPRTKQTVQMLMRDLDTMEELGVIT